MPWPLPFIAAERVLAVGHIVEQAESDPIYTGAPKSQPKTT